MANPVILVSPSELSFALISDCRVIRLNTPNLIENDPASRNPLPEARVSAAIVID